ncbi:MAG: glycosyltransferase [Candidatus Thermoplasmatota archaeon]|jgi:dolichol-phosphate mannosyltransferase|nr:glycosyltransferase [Candidatus Thermoplasmatota archaeon]
MNDVGSISIVVPVLNEEENIEHLLAEFDKLVSHSGLKEFNEVVFVDDGSKDQTAQIISGHKSSGHPYKIELVERDRMLGTVSASIEGAKKATNKCVVIMDGDLQHPPQVICELAKSHRSDDVITIASRHISNGGNKWSPLRGVISRTAILIAHLLIPPTRKVKDPISGFFMLNRDYIVCLEPLHRRSKILLYILSTNPELKIKEIPFVLVDRKKGNSKIINRNPSFILHYIIEVVSYMKFYQRTLSFKRTHKHSDYNYAMQK